MIDLINKVKEAGVAGLGGGGFPTYVKLQNSVDTVIANGVECEPLLWSDYYALTKYPQEFIEGFKLVKKAVGAARATISVKSKKKDLIDRIKPHLSDELEVAYQDDYYPAGDEVMLIKDLLGLTVPEGGIPPQVGVLVSNVGTIISIYSASKGIPLTKRFVTVTGAVKKPYTAEVPIGTSFEFLIDLAGGTEIENYKILKGGVMMGELSGPEDVVSKTTTGIVILPTHHPAVKEAESDIERIYRIARSVCDQCYLCSEVCPRLQIGHNIEPHKIMRMISFMLESSAVATSIAHYCCSCGLCSLFACPLGISPRRVIEEVQKKIPKLESTNPIKTPDPMMNTKRVPTGRLIARLGLEVYEQKKNYFLESIPDTGYVQLRMDQHAGAPAIPSVKPGDSVRTGDVVAQAAESEISLPVHASIDGTVTEVNESYVKIESIG
jgi:Na+-translocating ferredoxin:NAD+ oxidoreductase RnfC subunit